MLKIKNGFILRRIGDKYIAVTVGTVGKEINGMVRLNETGKYLWEKMKEGIEREELVKMMINEFEGLDKRTAESDLDKFLENIQEALE